MAAGMLDRYRKSGGFNQLLLLIESTGAQKQQKFLEMVREEDPRWAREIERRMLDLPRVMSWPDPVLMEVFGTVHDLCLATVLIGLPESERNRVSPLISHQRKRKFEELFGSKAPTPGEIATMNQKMLESVRKMIAENQLRVVDFDPTAQVPDDIEEKIKRGQLGTEPLAPRKVFASPAPGAAATPSAPPPPSAAATQSAPQGASAAATAQIEELQRENQKLRNELTQALGRLEQIRKIA